MQIVYYPVQNVFKGLIVHCSFIIDNCFRPFAIRGFPLSVPVINNIPFPRRHVQRTRFTKKAFPLSSLPFPALPCKRITFSFTPLGFNICYFPVQGLHPVRFCVVMSNVTLKKYLSIFILTACSISFI